MKQSVIPAKAGIPLLHFTNGIPAFAGMTPVFVFLPVILINH
jgi:hypothetical protein